MSLNSICFLGGGRITRILLGGWRAAGADVGGVLVSDPDGAVTNQLSASFGPMVEISQALDAVRDRTMVFLAVHPPVIPEVLGKLRGCLRDDAIVISLAPKFTLNQLSSQLNGFDRLARVIPNAASIICAGYNPVAWRDGLIDECRDQVRSVLQPLGQMPEVSESTLETYAVVTAMGPTYFWPQWTELASLAKTFGLSPEEADKAVQAMLKGAVATLFDSGLNADEVMDLIPVKPLAEFEPVMRETFQGKLSAVMEKIRPT